ncbi:MAG: alpha-amylase [Planctomycetota bacterium]|nr:MAG: alpha-amylase [Planctomycetota bacterium]
MTAVTFYFQVHQPFRLRPFRFFDIGEGKAYFEEESNQGIFRRVADRCYLPMNDLLLKLIDRYEGRFRCAFSLSGTVIEQMQRWYPEVLHSFQRLAETGAVEFLCETSHHSLSFLADEEEFLTQVSTQQALVESLFDQKPVTFRNTELVISNDLAAKVESLGFRILLGEGADSLLQEKSSQKVYGVKGTKDLKLLLRTYRFADDIAFRFSNKDWEGYPLLADTFADSMAEVPEDAPCLGLFMDYETFGEHQWADTGIFDFMEYLPKFLFDKGRFQFQTPKEVAAEHEISERLDIPKPVSWADEARDLTAWLGNPMQKAAHEALYDLLPRALQAADQGAPEWLEIWRKLSTSDHVYYMCTKFFADGDVHKYFSPYATPHDAFITFMNVLEDLARRLNACLSEAPAEQEPSTEESSESE